SLSPPLPLSLSLSLSLLSLALSRRCNNYMLVHCERRGRPRQRKKREILLEERDRARRSEMKREGERDEEKTERRSTVARTREHFTVVAVALPESPAPHLFAWRRP